jgi:hypothetical protein
VQLLGDTAGAYILPMTINNSRVTDYEIVLKPDLLLRRIFGDSSGIAKVFSRMRPFDLHRRLTLESTYDLVTFNPDFDYQLGLGGFNSFLTRQGQRAIGAINDAETTASSFIDLPFGLSAGANYSSTRADNYQLNGVGFLSINTTSVDWPDGTVSYRHAFAHGLLSVFQASSSVSQQNSTSITPLSNDPSASVLSHTLSVKPTALVTLQNGVSVSFNGSIDRSNGTADGNLTLNTSDSYNASIAWNVRMPKFISKLRRNLQTNLQFTDLSSFSCIQRTGDTSCVVFADTRHTEVRAGVLGALSRGMSGGLAVGYVLNNVRNLQQKTQTISLDLHVTVPLSSVGM